MVYGLYIDTPYAYSIGSDALDGNFREVDIADRTPDGGGMVGIFQEGRWVDPTFMPTKMRWRGGKRYRIPDFDRSHCINVSERAKAVIERFEPGVHQFLPAAYYNKQDELLEHRWFLIIGQRFDSTDHQRTTFVMRRVFVEPTQRWVQSWMSVGDAVDRKETQFIRPGLPHDTRSTFVFSRAKIGDHRLWVDKYMLLKDGILSNALAEAIRAEKMTGIVLKKQWGEEVDGWRCDITVGPVAAAGQPPMSRRRRAAPLRTKRGAPVHEVIESRGADAVREVRRLTNLASNRHWRIV